MRNRTITYLPQSTSGALPLSSHSNYIAVRGCFSTPNRASIWLEATQRRKDGGTRRRFPLDVMEEMSSHATSAPYTEIAEKDQGLPQLGSPASSRSTKGFCKICGANVGDFFNSWHKITGSYYVPALLGSYRSLLRQAGKRKGQFPQKRKAKNAEFLIAASKGTVIEHWYVLALALTLSRESRFVTQAQASFS